MSENKTPKSVKFSNLKAGTEIHLVQYDDGSGAAWLDNTTAVRGVPDNIFHEMDQMEMTYVVPSKSVNPTALTSTFGQVATSSEKVNTIAELMSNLYLEDIMDEEIASQIGKKNINTYRDKLLNLINEAGLLPVVSKRVVQIAMHMGNYNKALLHFATPASMALAKNDQTYRAAARFIETYCQHGTTETARMPLVKIAQSLPDVCALIYAQERLKRKIKPEEIADGIITALWSSSLNYDEATQALNKAAVEKAWTEFGTTPGVTTNRMGKILEFNAQIYANSEGDSIKLYQLDGSEFKPDSKYSRDDIIEYIRMLSGKFIKEN